MNECKHITFSRTNYVPESVISATPEPTTRIDFVKDEWQARQARWDNLEGVGEIVMEGVFPESRGIEYFALPGFNFGEYSGVIVKLELFETDTSTTDLLDLPAVEIGGAVPIGLYEFGVDPFASGSHPPLNNVYAVFLDEVIQAKRWRVTVTYDITPAGDALQIPIMNNTNQVGISVDNSAVIFENSNGIDDWEATADSNTGGTARKKIGGFHASALEGPRIVFPFKAITSGIYNVWGLVKAGVDGADSIYTIHDGESRVTVMSALTTTYSWQLIREISLVAGRVYYFEVCGRDADFIIDKIVVRPIALGSTAGDGGNESETTTVYDDNANISMRMVMMGRSLTLDKNFSYGTKLSRVTPPESYQTESGSYIPKKNQQKIRKMQLSLPLMTDDDRFNMALLEETNMGAPVLINAHPNRSEWFRGDHLMLGRFANELSFEEQFIAHNTQLTILEA